MKNILAKILAFYHRPDVESFIHTLITDLLYDAAVGAAFSQVIITKDFSETALYALGYSIFRTIARAIREQLKKKYPPTVVVADSPKL